MKECRRLIFFSPSEGVFPQNFFLSPLETVVSVLDLAPSGLEGKGLLVVVVAAAAVVVVVVVVVACSLEGGMKGWWTDLGPGSIG